MMRQDKNSNYIKYKKIGMKALNGKVDNTVIWELLTKEGLWKLPIPVVYGGSGDGWNEFTRSIKGFSSSYGNFEFISLIISHSCLIYAALENSDSKDINSHISSLINGNPISMHDSSVDYVTDESTGESFTFKRVSFERYLYAIISADFALNIISKVDVFIRKKSSLYDLNWWKFSKIAEEKIRLSQHILNTVSYLRG